jgi:copper chaperone NosL
MNPGKSLALSVCALLLLAFGAAALAAPALPGPKERCGVCGMFVAPYANWLAQMEFKDGSRAFFDGPKDLFVYFFDLAKYQPGAKVEEIAALYVTEYYTTRVLNVREVFLVSGSDVMGPMGQELVPVAGREQAETFRRDHGGKKILQFNGAELVEAAPAP